MTNPWTDPAIAAQQRALVDQQLQAKPWPVHFTTLVDAVRATQCPGQLLFVGSGVGHEREVLDRAGVQYRDFTGYDISPEAVRLARERYPESRWVLVDGSTPEPHFGVRRADVVVDASCVLHVDDWRAHLAALCAASRRWVILHRVPIVGDGSGWERAEPQRTETSGYGHTFPAWTFEVGQLAAEMKAHGFEFDPATGMRGADGNSWTMTFARPRHWVSYCDRNYLPRLKALHASMVRHCGPFKLHVLAWDSSVLDWQDELGEAGLDGNLTVQHIDAFIGTDEDPIGAVNGLRLSQLPGPQRSRVEHMWTVGPAWIADVMERTGEPVTYVDADVMFFSSPEPMFAEIGGAPAAVVPHGFARAAQGLPGPTQETHWPFGKFNLGILHISDREIAEWFADRCREWCYDKLDVNAGLYADQRYLEAIPHHMGGHIVQHPGACLGPWAVHTHSLDVRDGVIHFGNRPLIAYHFSGYRELPESHTVLTRPEYQLTERQADIIYTPFIRALEEAKQWPSGFVIAAAPK